MKRDIINVQVKEVLGERDAKKLAKKLARQNSVANLINIGLYGVFLYGVYKGYNYFLDKVAGMCENECGKTYEVDEEA